MSGFLPHTPRLRPALVASDSAALAVAAVAAFLVRFRPEDRGWKLDELLANPLFVAAAVLALLAVCVGVELYEPLQLRRRRETAVRVVVAALAWGAALALLTYLVPAWRFGRGLLAMTVVFWTVPAALVRVWVARWLARRPRPRALVVGDPEATGAFCRALGAHPYSPWDPLDGAGVAAPAVAAEIERRGAGLVVLAGERDGGLAPDLAALHFSGVPVVVASEIWAWLDGRLPVGELSPAAFLHQPGFGAVHWEMFNRFTRVLDVALASLLLLLASPLLVLAALVVLILSGRPVFYLQTRVGQFGRRFRLVKLRTMRRDAESDGPAFCAPSDPRVTPIGRVLRRLRIDELPQLVNVLGGQMSLVGPRPERPEFVAELAAQIPFYTFRLAVPPGVTGWAQVNNPYSSTVEEHRRKLEYDLFFIRERSVGLYLLILLRTLSAAIGGVRGRGQGTGDVEQTPDQPKKSEEGR